MEYFDCAWYWVVSEVMQFGLRWIVLGVPVVLGVLLFGRGYKRRIAELEKKAGGTVVHVQGDYHDFRDSSGGFHVYVKDACEIVSPVPIDVKFADVNPAKFEFGAGQVEAVTEDKGT